MAGFYSMFLSLLLFTILVALICSYRIKFSSNNPPNHSLIGLDQYCGFNYPLKPELFNDYITSELLISWV